MIVSLPLDEKKDFCIIIYKCQNEGLDQHMNFWYLSHIHVLGQKQNAAYKTYIVVFHQSLANILSQFERWFLDYEFLGLS